MSVFPFVFAAHVDQHSFLFIHASFDRVQGVFGVRQFGPLEPQRPAWPLRQLQVETVFLFMDFSCKKVATS